MKFDVLQQVRKCITPLLQIMIDPSDNACECQLFSFRLLCMNEKCNNTFYNMLETAF